MPLYQVKDFPDRNLERNILAYNDRVATTMVPGFSQNREQRSQKGVDHRPLLLCDHAHQILSYCYYSVPTGFSPAKKLVNKSCTSVKRRVVVLYPLPFLCHMQLALDIGHCLMVLQITPSFITLLWLCILCLRIKQYICYNLLFRISSAESARYILQRTCLRNIRKIRAYCKRRLCLEVH